MIEKCENYEENGKILFKNEKENQNYEKHSVKIRLPWKRQIVWAKTCQGSKKLNWSDTGQHKCMNRISGFNFGHLNAPNTEIDFLFFFKLECFW